MSDPWTRSHTTIIWLYRRLLLPCSIFLFFWCVWKHVPVHWTQVQAYFDFDDTVMKNSFIHLDLWAPALISSDWQWLKYNIWMDVLNLCPFSGTMQRQTATKYCPSQFSLKKQEEKFYEIWPPFIDHFNYVKSSDKG